MKRQVSPVLSYFHQAGYTPKPVSLPAEGFAVDESHRDETAPARSPVVGGKVARQEVNALANLRTIRAIHAEFTA